MEFRSKGSMFLRWKNQTYKVLSVRSPAKDLYHFECINLETKEAKTLKFRLGGFLEAADKAFEKMTKAQDIFFLDMDNKGQARILTEEQVILVDGHAELGLPSLTGASYSVSICSISADASNALVASPSRFCHRFQSQNPKQARIGFY